MSKKDKQSVELSVSTGTPEILQALEKKISSLKHIEETVYKTSGTLDNFGSIKTETKVDNLIKAFSMIRGKHDAYAKSAVELDVKQVPQFSISGGTLEDWKHDIKLRIEVINHKDTLDKLNSYKERMSKFLSEQDQKAMLMKEMGDFLGV
jgi:hypothetical protein